MCFNNIKVEACDLITTKHALCLFSSVGYNDTYYIGKHGIRAIGSYHFISYENWQTVEWA